MLDQWAKEHEGEALVCKVNVDVASDLAMIYRIRAMPTLIALDPTTGREIKRCVGTPDILDFLQGFKVSKN
jgi:thioredoxin-like negative regulator of GroEL